MLLPVGNPMISPQVAGSVEGTRTIFVLTDLGAYMIDLNSLPTRKDHILLLSQEICLTSVGPLNEIGIYPYLSFFNRPGTFHLKKLTFARVLFIPLFCTSLYTNRASQTAVFLTFLYTNRASQTAIDHQKRSCSSIISNNNLIQARVDHFLLKRNTCKYL
jgi:hypothetical protein